MIKAGENGPGPVVYWMSRDQRASDNWALEYARALALDRRRPLVAVFSLVPDFLGATLRQYSFMLKGLEEVERTLAGRNIRFILLEGEPRGRLPRFVTEVGAAAMVTDFDPLRIKRRWKDEVAGRIKIPFYEVDAHNVVPCWEASGKREYAARTFRPRISKKLGEFLVEFPKPGRHPFGRAGKKTDWPGVMRRLRGRLDASVGEAGWIRPGEKAALSALKDFIKNRLRDYPRAGSDPSKLGESELSPYLHFGNLSAQRALLEVKGSGGPREAVESFLEQLMVRKELSDNFCLHTPAYDTFDAFPDWARKTLDEHRGDKREYLYTLEELERSMTHDRYWNAAQAEMVTRGKTHGYMRMYWAKKVLEWSPSPEEALARAVYLNDRYQLDGRDPNGYTGIAWSIGGVHDRAWPEREVFGKVRYMSSEGLERKFDMEEYVKRVRALEEAA